MWMWLNVRNCRLSQWYNWISRHVGCISYGWVGILWCFKGMRCLHFQCLTLKMKTLWSFKMSWNTHPTTKCHIPEGSTLDAKNYPAANTIHCSIEQTCFMNKNEGPVFSSCIVLPWFCSLWLCHRSLRWWMEGPPAHFLLWQVCEQISHHRVQPACVIWSCRLPYEASPASLSVR